MGDAEISPIEASVKFRCDKKWKNRFCRFTKVSSDLETVRLLVFKNAKSVKKKEGPELKKDLYGFYGTETGFSLEKESHTLAILCQSYVAILAFQYHQSLVDWQVWLRKAFGIGSLFYVQPNVCPSDESILSDYCKAEPEKNSVRLHIQDGRFCVAAECPPRILEEWKFGNLRRFGPIHNRFCFEVGSRGGTAPGLYMFTTSQSDQLQLAFTMASMNKLHEYLTNRARPVSDTPSKSATESPEKSGISFSIPSRRIGDSTGLGTGFSESSLETSGYNRLESVSDCGFSQTEMRPLLSPSTASSYSGIWDSGSKKCDIPEFYTNDVFEPESPRPVDTEYEPQPFMLSPQKEAPRGFSGEGKGPFRMHKAFMPRTVIIDPRPQNSAHALMESNYLNLPQALRESRISEQPKSCDKKPLPSRRGMPPPPLPKYPKSNKNENGGIKRENYINQNFIDSLQFYCNANVLILPNHISIPYHGAKSEGEAAPSYTPMDMPKENYVPFYPPSPVKKNPCSDNHEEEAPPDPTNSAGEDEKAPLRKTPSPEITALVHQSLPPWKPIARSSSRSPDFAELDWGLKLNSNYSEVAGKSAPRRAVSVCSPTPPALHDFWVEKGLSLPRGSQPPKTTETVGQALTRSVSISEGPMARQRSLSGASGRRGILRHSSRKAKEFFGNLLGKRQSLKSGSQVSCLQEEAGLDLDEPEYLAAHHVDAEQLYINYDKSFSTPADRYKRNGNGRPISIESSGSSDIAISGRFSPDPDPDLDAILDNLSIHSSDDNPATGRGSFSKQKTSVTETDHYYSRIRRQSGDPVGQIFPVKHNAKTTTPPGMVRPDSLRRQQRPKVDLSRPVTGSYSVYDGDKMDEKRQPDTSDNLTFGLVGRKYSTQKIDRRLTSTPASETCRYNKWKPQNLNLSARLFTAGLDRSPGAPLASPPVWGLAEDSPRLTPGTGPSSTRSSPMGGISPKVSTAPALERKGTGPKIFRFPETLVTDRTPQLNYCDLVIGRQTEDRVRMRPPPKSAFPSINLQKGTNYARIDPLATRAAKDASNQRVAEMKVRSSSVQTLSTNERKPSRARRLFSKKQRSLSRRTSVSSLGLDMQ